MVQVSIACRNSAHYSFVLTPLFWLLQRADVLIEQVETIFHETIPAAGLEPDQVTLNTVVLAYANAGRGDEAYSFVADEFEARECAPDERTYRALIKMVCDYGCIIAARHMLAVLFMRPPERLAFAGVELPLCCVRAARLEQGYHASHRSVARHAGARNYSEQGCTSC